MNINNIVNEKESTINWMDIKLFRELGFLQEINRLFLHPLGLALVTQEDNGVESLAGVWDYRNDPEGIFYDLSSADDAKVSEFRFNSLQVRKLLDSKRESRIRILNSEIEAIPLEGKKV